MSWLDNLADILRKPKDAGIRGLNGDTVPLIDSFPINMEEN